MFKKIIEKATNNLIWKIISVVIAFLFWWSVVSYEDPIKEVTFQNIPVDKVNVESVIDNNYAIEYEEGEFVDVVVTAKRSVADRLTASDIYAFADISNMSITNAIDIEAQIDADYQSIDIYPANMKVNIEGIISANKEVQYYYEGEVAEGYIALDPILTPSVITITGPESQVGLVSSVIIPIPIDQATKDVTLYYVPDILDAQNNIVTQITTNVEEVSVTVPVEMTKVVDIEFEEFDTIVDGYRLMGIQLDRETVVIRGQEEDIEGIDTIIINDISLAEISNDTILTVHLEDYLSEGVKVLSDDKSVTVNIDVEIIVELEIEITTEDIDIQSIPEGLIFAFAEEQNVIIRVSGINSDLNNVTAETLNSYIRINDLEQGTHEVEVHFYLPYNIEMLSDIQKVEIELRESPEIIDEEDSTN